jgi:two-component system OmpR family response regulator/two-component system response regulator QseB
MRLLLVEDDARLAHAVRTWMGHDRIEVDWITHGGEVIAALRAQAYDWLVLDLGLPDMKGDDVLGALRSAGFQLPVIVMTAREQVQDRIRLLDLGADDFLVKPVHLDELAARLRAVSRRQDARPVNEPALRHGAVCMMPASRTVSVEGQYVPLTNREFWLLEALLRRKGQVVTRVQLLESLHGWSDDAVGNSVDVHVHHLRRKLGNQFIKTVRGQGYTLSTDI